MRPVKEVEGRIERHEGERICLVIPKAEESWHFILAEDADEAKFLPEWV